MLPGKRAADTLQGKLFLDYFATGDSIIYQWRANKKTGGSLSRQFCFVAGAGIEPATSGL